MSNRTRRSVPLSVMMAQLTAASWEVMWRRSMMMAEGACSAAEYQRMIFEKWIAWQRSATALWQGKDPSAVMRPFLTRARGNAKRLRRRTR